MSLTVLSASGPIVSAGDFFLTFFRDFVGTPALLVGLFVLVGNLLLRKKISHTILSFFKTIAGFLILGAGAATLVAPLQNFQALFTDLFGVSGIVPANDPFAIAFQSSFPQIFQLGSIIMVVSLGLNIVLAYTSRLKYIFLSGHVLLYMSIMLAGVMVLGAGFDISQASDYAIALISSALFLSIYMVVAPALTRSFVKDITTLDNVAMAHTGNFNYVLAGWIGRGIHKWKKGKVKSTEDFKFPQHLQFFRNTFVSLSIAMLVVFLVVYIPQGIRYQTGLRSFSEANQDAAGVLENLFGANANRNWVVQAFLDAFIFSAGVEILLFGVRMIIGEIVPAFKGISEKLIKNSKAGLDCPIVFPYAPNAVLIGFISSILAGVLGIGLTFGIAKIERASNLVPFAIIIPGIVAHFFLGATSGVFGNSKGGIWGAIIGSFVNGLIITFIPIFFILGNWVPGKQPLGWGDSDYIIGIIPGLLALAKGVAARVMLILIPLSVIILMALENLVFKFKNPKAKNNSQALAT